MEKVGYTPGFFYSLIKKNIDKIFIMLLSGCMSKEKRKKVVQKFLSDFPNLPNLTLAKMIYKDNKLLFTDIDAVRSAIRYHKGSLGTKNLRKLKSDKFLSKEKQQKKYNLPEAIETDYQPFKIIGNKGLIFSDTHVPFHSVSALETMFEYTNNFNPDFIIINGDGMDCFELSRFCIDPTVIPFPEERDRMKAFLSELQRIYPKTKIYYKFGNHEKRWETYLQEKAPEIYGMSEFRLEVLLGLFEMGIEYVPEDRYINLMGLFVIHGHEYKNAITSPANPARTFFLRTKDCTIGGHYHQPSEHTEPTINDKLITCWSIGCMCDLHPKYMPLNKWGHGFAKYEWVDKDFWRVENKRIIKDKVV